MILIAKYVMDKILPHELLFVQLYSKVCTQYNDEWKNMDNFVA